MITFAGVEYFLRSFFFGAPEIYPLALARIGFGLMLFFQYLELYQAGARYFGFWGILSLSYQRNEGSPFTVFRLFGADARWIKACCAAGVLFSAFLAFGFLSQLSAFVLLLLAISQLNSNIYIESGGNALPRAMLFLMVFAPTDAAFSLDGWFGIGLSSHWPFLMQNWAIRLMQIQLTLLYLFSILFKFRCDGWFTRDAVFSIFYAYHARRSFSPPAWIRFPLASLLATLGTVFLQCTFPIAIWFEELRLPYVAAMAILHISMALNFTLGHFMPAILASLLLFLQPLLTSFGFPAGVAHANSFAEVGVIRLFAGFCLLTMIVHGGPPTLLTLKIRSLRVFRPMQWFGLLSSQWAMMSTPAQFHIIHRHELRFSKGDQSFTERPIHFFEKQFCSYLHIVSVFDCWIEYALRRHPGYDVTAVLMIYELPKLSGGLFSYNRDLEPKLLQEQIIWQSLGRGHAEPARNLTSPRQASALDAAA